MKPLRLIAVALALVSTLVATTAQAADPPGGTVSKSKRSVSWTGTFDAPVTELRCEGPDLCDHFALKVNFGDGTRVTVSIPAVSPATDIDFFVYDPKGVEVASSGNFPGEAEVATFTHKAKYRNKPYDVAVVPYLVIPGTTYKANARVR
jgi:hypothetical protein